MHLQPVLSWKMPGSAPLFLLCAFMSCRREIYSLLPPLTYTKAALRTRVDGGGGFGLVFSLCASFCMFLQPPVNNGPSNGASHRQWLLQQTPTRK
jgi:hypothetical protein